MLPLYAARIEDLGPGDFVKADCAACHHVALLTAEALLREGLRPAAKLLDLKNPLRCRWCGANGRDVTNPGRAGRLGGLTVARLHSTPDDPTDHQAEHD
jgi:hypothetical protein